VSVREGSGVSEPSVRVPVNGLFRASTAGLVILGLLVLVWAAVQGEALLVVPAVVVLGIAGLRLRAGVVVSTTSVRVTGELRTRTVDLDDVALVEVARDGAGWMTQIVRHDGPPCRVVTLGSLSEEGARQRVEELSLAIDEMRRLRDVSNDEAV
jgi:hypothetical protein